MFLCFAMKLSDANIENVHRHAAVFTQFSGGGATHVQLLAPVPNEHSPWFIQKHHVTTCFQYECL